jgi:putative hydrolase
MGFDTHMILETVPAPPSNTTTRISPSTGHHATLPGPWHAPGQLDWLDNGCERAERAGITPDRVLNTRAAADITSR